MPYEGVNIKLLLSLITLAILNTSYAKEAEKVENEITEEKIIEELKKENKYKTSGKKRSSSKDNREELRYTFSHGGGSLYKRMVYTSSLGYIVNSKLIVNLTYISLETTASKYDNTEKETITYDNGDGSVVELGFKYFESNSFYVNAGIYYRNQTSRERDIDDGGFFQFSSSQDGEGTVYDSGLVLGIGNQWQWSHFTMGVEWVGTSLSLGNWKYENNGEGQSVALDNMRLLNLYVGASF